MQPLDAGPLGPSAPAGAMPGLPLPPGFPPGVDPATYRLAEVEALLKRAAYFPLFSVPDPGRPNRPVLASFPFLPPLPFLLTAVEVNEQTHRFRLGTEVGAEGLRAVSVVGEPAATVAIRWTVIPDDYNPTPDSVPPPTLLNPFRSQRFTMLGGHFSFSDRDGSGFHGFGAGRTFPAVEGGRSLLRIGAVIDVLEGFGRLRGLPGTVVVNGIIRPPDELALNITVRMMDPTASLLASGPSAPLATLGDPDPGASFLAFLGEPDPHRPVTLNLAPDGRILGSNVHELLRAVTLDVETAAGLRGHSREGPIVGRVDATLYFDPLADSAVTPIQTRQGVFTFHDAKGLTTGTVRADMVEGRAFRTPLPGAPMPVFRFAGFGPISGGSGAFAGATGLMSMNSAVSVFPRTLSNLYVLRLVDPAGRHRAAPGSVLR